MMAFKHTMIGVLFLGVCAAALWHWGAIPYVPT